MELGVDLTADLEVKVDGSLDTTEAVERGVSEFARWYAASRLGEVAVQRAALDPARAKLLRAFDGLDTAKVLARDPDVAFSGTFGGNLGATKSLDGEEDGDSLEVSMGAGMRIQSGDGDQFELGNQKVLRGKAALSIGDWGVEASGEREAGDPNAAKWTLGLGATREGKLVQGKDEIVLNAAAVALSKHARSGTLANTSAVRDALEQLMGVVTDPTAHADKAVASGEIGGEIGIEVEVEVETKRKSEKSPWKPSDVSGSVSVSAMSGLKSPLELPTGKLGKIAGSKEQGVKISKAIG